MSTALTIQCKLHLDPRNPLQAVKGSQVADQARPRRTSTEPGRVPRVARLLALALRFEQLIGTGVVPVYAELARFGHVSRARITQIMNLLLLAPDIQEAILFLPRVHKGREPIQLDQLQSLAATLNWRTQRRRWRSLRQETT